MSPLAALLASGLLAFAFCGPVDVGPDTIDGIVDIVVDHGFLRALRTSDHARHRSEEELHMDEDHHDTDGPKSSIERGEEEEEEEEEAHRGEEAEQHDEHDYGAVLTPVRSACLTLVMLSWMAWIGIFKPWQEPAHRYGKMEDSARPLGGGVRAAIWASFFIYWVAMPVTVMLSAFRWTSCKAGVPNAVYGIYTGFLALQLGLAGYVIAASGWKLPPFLQLNIMKSSAVLGVFTVLENSDMGTDVMFPASVSACSAELTPAWLASWEQAWIPGFMLPVLEAMQFDGFALTLFVTGAYLPQLFQLLSFLTPVFFALSFASVCIWVTVHWALGLGVAVIAISVPVLSVGVLGVPRSELVLCPENLLYNSGVLIYEDKVDVGLPDPANRGLVYGTTKVVFENLLQLWVQAGFLGLSFDSLDSDARAKVLASISLGLAIAASKLLPMALQLLSITDLFIIPFGLVLLLAFLFLAWTVARAVFAFKCTSHIWNLTSGCVTP